MLKFHRIVKTEMDSYLKFVVTTSRNANSRIRTRALQKATAWDLPYAERHDVSLADTAGDAQAVFVFGHEGLSLLTGKTQLRFSLGTAASFLFAGELSTVIGWEWTFAVVGVAALGAVALMALAFRPITPQAEEKETATM